MTFDGPPNPVAFGNDNAAAEYLQSLLKTGERVVWTGRPSPAAFAINRWPAAAWGAVGTAGFLAAIWFNWDDPRAGALSAVPFLTFCAAVAGWMAAAPLRNALRANRTYYAVTTRRVLIVHRLVGWSATSIRPTDFAQVTRYDLDDDRGSVRLRFSERGSLFGRMIVSAKLSDGMWGIGDFRAAMLAVHRLMASVQT
ncbi:hypothetical protein [Thalassobaculum sp.]|uniref:hypothetical protein n=1 Tax=Thalassobaculum sp. TaxID=2022740 RepID=UPI0032EE57CA